MTAPRTGKERKYEHKTPQINLDHTPTPVTLQRGINLSRPLRCKHCGSPLVIADENAGPESLKARFPF